MIDISVIIPCLNSEKTIKLAIDSVLNQKGLESLQVEILVIDNGSTDGTKKILRGYKNQLNYIYEPIKNRSKARNTGIRNSNGKYIVFVDSDNVIAPKWIITMYTQISSNSLYGGGEGHISSIAIGEINPIEEIRRKIKEGSKVMLSVVGRKFPMINTAACIYTVEALYDVGLFDESLNYHEDIDLSKRVFYAGYVLFSNSKAKSKCYNDEPTFISFVKRSFNSGKEFSKYNKKWDCIDQSSSFVGFQMANLKNILNNLTDNSSFIVKLYRTIFYLSSSLGHFIELGRVDRHTEKSQGQLFDEHGEWGIVETDKHFILKNHGNKKIKFIPKLFDLNIFLRKIKLLDRLTIIQLFRTMNISFHSLLIVGSRSNDKKSVLSRNDLDILVVFKTEEEVSTFREKNSKLKTLLNNNLDIVSCSLYAIENNQVFYNQSIKFSKYSLDRSILVAGESILNLACDKLHSSNGVQLYYLFFKKLVYFSLKNDSEAFGYSVGNNIDCIHLYKFIAYFNINIDSIDQINIDDSFDNNLYLFSVDELELLNLLKKNKFLISYNEYNKNIDILTNTMNIAVKIFLDKHSKFTDIIKSNLSNDIIDKNYYDYNFIGLDTDLTSDEYIEKFLKSLDENLYLLKERYIC